MDFSDLNPWSNKFFNESLEVSGFSTEDQKKIKDVRKRLDRNILGLERSAEGKTHQYRRYLDQLETSRAIGEAMGLESEAEKRDRIKAEQFEQEARADRRRLMDFQEKAFEQGMVNQREANAIQRGQLGIQREGLGIQREGLGIQRQGQQLEFADRKQSRAFQAGESVLDRNLQRELATNQANLQKDLLGKQQSFQGRENALGRQHDVSMQHKRYGLENWLQGKNTEREISKTKQLHPLEMEKLRTQVAPSLNQSYASVIESVVGSRKNHIQDAFAALGNLRR